MARNPPRAALENATGITVPERSFIFWVVVGYICVLVPLNWLLFRLIGRVEWAWIAAPLIAIGCTVIVVHQAQLNIGFARSRNEIAVVEMQPGYSRGTSPATPPCTRRWRRPLSYSWPIQAVRSCHSRRDGNANSDSPNRTVRSFADAATIRA